EEEVAPALHSIFAWPLVLHVLRDLFVRDEALRLPLWQQAEQLGLGGANSIQILLPWRAKPPQPTCFLLTVPVGEFDWDLAADSVELGAQTALARPGERLDHVAIHDVTAARTDSLAVLKGRRPGRMPALEARAGPAALRPLVAVSDTEGAVIALAA